MNARLENHGLLFGVNNAIRRAAKKVEEELTNDSRLIVAYEPYPEQIVILKSIFQSEGPLPEKILKDFIENFDVNLSDRYAMTLLHDLIWLNRCDLAKLLVTSSEFNKINYKFCLPDVSSGRMYASALDLAIGLWMTKEINTDLNFIELLLQFGAQLPQLDKCFLNNHMLHTFYPTITDVDQRRSSEELINLLSLLSRYGFSIDAMEKEFNEQLFGEDQMWKKFREAYSSQEDEKKKLLETSADVPNKEEGLEKLNKEEQRLLEALGKENQEQALKTFMEKLKLAVVNNKKGEVLVELDEKRLDNGESTLRLPFDPTDRPCCVM